MNRKTLALSLLALLGATAAALRAEVAGPSYDDLAANFAKPPKTARPGVYWYFMDGNMSKEGATKDLEAMSKAGIGYVIFLEINIGVPRGKVDFMSDEWIDFFKYIVSECERLDIQMILGTGPGWCGSGGPWVEGRKSMRHLVSSSTSVEGGARRTVVLPKPPPHAPYFGEGAFTPELLQTWKDYYEDVAVLAFPESEKSDARIANWDEKAHFVRAPYTSAPGVKQFLPAPVAAANPRGGIDPAKVVVLTDRMKPDGTLEWDAPAGKWTVMRFGTRNNGAVTRPAPLPGVGFECDKFSESALADHFSHFSDRLFKALGRRPDCFGGIKYLHIDSWEMSAQNWTDGFRREFTRRRSYDPLPFFPAWEGRIVADENVTERFLWDLRRTSQELIVEKHALAAKKYAHDHGLLLSIEPYDMNPSADLELGTAADVPMGEFWCDGYGFNSAFAVIEGTSAAHVIGQNVVPAESFTACNDAWRPHPASMKNQNDWAMAIGLNRLMFHTFQHQCLADDLKPGMAMGPYGVHWDRNQTWWPMALGYHSYLARCQYMLQQGRSVADILYLAPESTPHVFRPPASALEGGFDTNMPDRRGYNFDGCPPSVFLKAVVRDGKIVLPGGASYRLAVLPQYGTATPRMMEKFRELLTDGATLVGLPPEHSPSLTDYPACDGKVRAIARELWGEKREPVRKIGKGLLFRCDGDNDCLYESYGATARRLAEKGVPPDFESDTGAVRYHHRTSANGDLYFIASRSDKSQKATCSFRMTGKTAEVWDALDGTRYAVPATDDGKTTKVTLDLAPHQSYFVVFSRRGTASARMARPASEGSRTVAGPWKVTFAPPVGKPFTAEFASLTDWTANENLDVRYFSGIATYEVAFDAPERFASARTWIELGKVLNMARVTLNGKDLGIQWTDPWRVEATGALKEKGNVLRIEVANLWTNRLVGDAQLPNDGLDNNAWPEWVLKGEKRPTKRVAFQAWYHYDAKSPLEPSGLLGPVRLATESGR